MNIRLAQNSRPYCRGNGKGRRNQRRGNCGCFDSQAAVGGQTDRASMARSDRVVGVRVHRLHDAHGAHQGDRE